MEQLVESAVRLPRELLRDKVAIVTGGSRGIGRATALRLAEAGAHVIVNYLERENEAAQVVAGVRELGVEAFAIQGDVGRSDDAAELVEIATHGFGRLDLLVANAGIWEGAPVEEMPDEVWDRVLDANLRGTWTTCRAAVPAMKESSSGGSIVIVSSTAGQRGEAGYSNYAASKGGQISFAKSLAVELAPKIRVNCVAPGWVDTEMNAEVFGRNGFRDEAASAIPLRRIATADDVALSIVFLASDWARHISGEVLNVNGGAVLCG